MFIGSNIRLRLIFNGLLVPVVLLLRLRTVNFEGESAWLVDSSQGFDRLVTHCGSLV